MLGDRPARPTLADVAARAGVSRAQAARALGGYGAVKSEVRARVSRAAADLGYRTDGLARSLRTGATQTIGVILADVGDPFFARVVRGIADVARTQGFEVFVINSDEDLELERNALAALTTKRVDGVIVSAASASEITHLQQVQADRLPLVLIDRTIPSLGLDAVVTDNRGAIYHSVADLNRLGHRRIGLIFGGEGSIESESALRSSLADMISSTSERIRGYLDAVTDAAVPVDTQLIRKYDAPSADRAAEAARRLLALDEPPTALIATDSNSTLGILDAVRDSGLECPGDVSIVGFDDSPWARHTAPRLTTIRQPAHEMGKQAARHLLDRISGHDGPGRLTVLANELVSRDSVGEVNVHAATGPNDA